MIVTLRTHLFMWILSCTFQLCWKQYDSRSDTNLWEVIDVFLWTENEWLSNWAKVPISCVESKRYSWQWLIDFGLCLICEGYSSELNSPLSHSLALLLSVDDDNGKCAALLLTLITKQKKKVLFYRLFISRWFYLL